MDESTLRSVFFLKEVVVTLRLLIARYVKKRSPDSFVWFNPKHPKGLSISLSDLQPMLELQSVPITIISLFRFLQRHVVSLSKYSPHSFSGALPTGA